MLRRRWKWQLLSVVMIIFHSQSTFAAAEVPPMGSILFEDHGFEKKCFVQNDVALLATRLKFQTLVPDDGSDDRKLMNDDGVGAMIRYFYRINEIIEQLNEDEVRQLIQKSFYDLLGSYLKFKVLPIVKFSFYAGSVTFTMVENVSDLYSRCRELLDTNGNGWSEPNRDLSQFTSHIEPVAVSQSNSNEAIKACANLVMNQNDDDNDEDMLVQLPKMETGEDGEDLSTIWLPFKRKHIYSINSKASAFVLLRYFVIVTQCYQYQGITQSMFNKKLKIWLVDNVMPYLEDEQLYPAFGAVLRIYETIKEPNEKFYSELKSKHRANDVAAVQGFTNDENFFPEDEKDINWWIQIGLMSGGGFITLMLIMWLLIRICVNRRRIRRETSVERPRTPPPPAATSPSPSSSFTGKISSFFRSSQHAPEHDEYYPYRKVSTEDQRTISFENEKKKKGILKRQKGRQKQVQLPVLGSESDDEIVLHTMPLSKSSSGSSLNVARSRRETTSAAERFGIAEDSEDEVKKSKGKRLLNKMRFRSPLRDKKRDAGTSG